VHHLSFNIIVTALVGYLLGSCPNGLLICNALGVDIRKQGSGNIGATNVLRVVGKKWGYLVFALDALKGLVAVLVGYLVARVSPSGASGMDLFGIIGGVACILGHTFPMWLRFRGGKGVATSAGVLLGLMPVAVVSVFLVWLLFFQISRYVSLASIAAAISLPILVAIYLHFGLVSGSALLPFSMIIAVIVIWRHRSNMQRLFQGREEPFEK
jgi:glycerol-3-phosphate acyltransferase PlsY